jgi:peptide-methionine (S)-S-oxide reductase
MKIFVSRTISLAATCLALSAGAAQVFSSTSLPGFAAGAGEAAAGKTGATKAVASKAPEQHLQKAIFAAGCFWGVEDEFRHEKGVVDAISGFTGGNKKNPTYKEVCTGATHHAEAVEVLYDPTKVTYDQLLSTFWKMHDPTTVNSQGPDIGEQYRSAIFYLNDEQKKEAIASRDKLAASGTYKSPIATQIVPATEFYKAEDYHQHYFEKHPDAAACHRRL